MRRRRIFRGESTAALVTSATLAAAAGFALGMLLTGNKTRVRKMFARLLDRLDADADDGSPPLSVYEMDRVAHDDHDLDEADDYDDTEDENGDAAEPSEVEERVLAAFVNDPVLSRYPVEISSEDDGLVELRGWVDGRRDRVHATTLARGVPGVVDVENRIRVRRRSSARTN